MLEAFIHEVRAFKNAGILEAALADQMIAVAEACASRLSRAEATVRRRRALGPGPRPAVEGPRRGVGRGGRPRALKGSTSRAMPAGRPPQVVPLAYPVGAKRRARRSRRSPSGSDRGDSHDTRRPAPGARARPGPRRRRLRPRVRGRRRPARPEGRAEARGRRAARGRGAARARGADAPARRRRDRDRRHARARPDRRPAAVRDGRGPLPPEPDGGGGAVPRQPGRAAARGAPPRRRGPTSRRRSP